jgi:hypothetical protein
MHFSFTGSICTSKYNHFIELRVEGQKVASQQSMYVYLIVHISIKGILHLLPSSNYKVPPIQSPNKQILKKNSTIDNNQQTYLGT